MTDFKTVMNHVISHGQTWRRKSWPDPYRIRLMCKEVGCQECAIGQAYMALQSPEGTAPYVAKGADWRATDWEQVPPQERS